MKNRLLSTILVLILALFITYLTSNDNTRRVMNINTPTNIQIDMNRNNVIDDNEKFCIPNITAFTSNIRLNSEDLAKKLGLTFSQTLAAGYLADEFAKNLLEGKFVEVKLNGNETPECRYADILVDGKSYTELLKNSGYAIINDKPVLSEKFNDILKKSASLNLVILNHHSGKYHTLDCEYGKIAHDAVIMPVKDIQKDYKPCKFCHVDKHTNNNKVVEVVKSPPNIITSGNIKLILTDFTKIIKPDRNCTHAVCREFVSLINSSTKSIDIASYGWAEIPAINRAFEKAVARGVKIRIVYDTDTSGGNYYSETSEFLSKFKNIRSDRVDNNPKLTNMLMHNKFAIFDSSKVYTGSMNFSTTGFSGFNHNNVLIINSKNIADIYTNEFEQMYSGKFHTFKNKTQNNTDISNNSGTISVYFSPQDKPMSTELVQIIRNSKDYIYIPSFLFTHKTLSNELINAHKRGVDVKIIIDATNTYGKHSVFKSLRASGIPVKVENYAGKLHSKVMIIDNEYLVAGSANFSNSGENKNDENMLIIRDSLLSKFYRDYFLYFWAKIPDKYLKSTVKAESKYSIGSCYDGVDNDFDGKIDNSDEGCKSK